MIHTTSSLLEPVEFCGGCCSDGCGDGRSSMVTCEGRGATDTVDAVLSGFGGISQSALAIDEGVRYCGVWVPAAGGVAIRISTGVVTGAGGVSGCSGCCGGDDTVSCWMKGATKVPRPVGTLTFRLKMSCDPTTIFCDIRGSPVGAVEPVDRIPRGDPRGAVEPVAGIPGTARMTLEESAEVPDRLDDCGISPICRNQGIVLSCVGCCS